MFKMYSAQGHMSTDAMSAPACCSARNSAYSVILDAASLAASFLFTLLGVRITKLVRIFHIQMAEP